MLGTLLYVLDANEGLYTFEIKTPIDYSIKDFFVAIRDARRFSFHK
jgi:hypothetical protein